MRRFFACFLILTLYAGAAGAAGTVVNETFWSSSLSMEKEVQVYLPPGYDPAREDPYPVVYYLHGADSDAYGWPDLPGIMDELYEGSEAPLIQPMILVRPDGNAGDYGGSAWVNSELYGDFENYVVYDLTLYIESSYHASSEANERAVIGYSMGGGGAMHTALKHHDLYQAVASHSGALDMIHFLDWIPVVKAEGVSRSPKKPYMYRPSNGVFTRFFFLASGAYSPNPQNRPQPVDFPLDEQGNLIDDVFDRWFAFDPATLAEAVPVDTDLQVYFDCGTNDELMLYPFNTGFAAKLDLLGLPHVFEDYEGGHGSHILERLPLSIIFVDQAFGAGAEE